MPLHGDTFHAEGLTFCLTPLWSRISANDPPAAVLVLGFRDAVPSLPERDIMNLIAAQVSDVVIRSSSGVTPAPG